MSTLKIVINPDDRLRQISKEIGPEGLKNGAYGEFIEDMAETMLAKDGIGLAAPQVGENIRVIVVNTKDGPLAMVNPVLTKKSLTKDWDEEGCLSIPNIFGQVRRHKHIHCRFATADGTVKKIAASGLLARVIQHEIDHLDGILFIDKAKNIREHQAHNL